MKPPRPLHLRNLRFIRRRATDLMKVRRSQDRNVVVMVVLLPLACISLAVAIFVIVLGLS